MLFEENYDLLFFISITNSLGDPIKIIDKYTLPGFRKVEYVNRNLEIDYEQVTMNYENIGEVILLQIRNLDYDFKRFESNYIVLNHLIEKGWQGTTHYDLYLLKYKQDDLIMKVLTVDHSILPQPIYCSNIYAFGRGGLSYCAKPNSNYFFGAMDFIVRY